MQRPYKYINVNTNFLMKEGRKIPKEQFKLIDRKQTDNAMAKEKKKKNRL